MSHEYLDDLFGEQVETSPKYVEAEQKAIKMLWKISTLPREKLSYDEIYEGFETVRKEFVELVDNTVEPGQPLWLSKFLSFNFLKWADWYMLRKAFTEHREQFDSEKSVNKYYEIEQMGHDEIFFKKCEYYFGKLHHKIAVKKEIN